MGATRIRSSLTNIRGIAPRLRRQTRALLARIDSASSRAVGTPRHTANVSGIPYATGIAHDNTHARVGPDLQRTRHRSSPGRCGWGAWSQTCPDEASRSASARSLSHHPPVPRTPARVPRPPIVEARNGSQIADFSACHVPSLGLTPLTPLHPRQLSDPPPNDTPRAAILRLAGPFVRPALARHWRVRGATPASLPGSRAQRPRLRCHVRDSHDSFRSRVGAVGTLARCVSADFRIRHIGLGKLAPVLAAIIRSLRDRRCTTVTTVMPNISLVKELNTGTGILTNSHRCPKTA
jgi:hypothetical protein